MNQKEHWENVYQTKPSSEVSWFQPHLEKSLQLIAGTGLDKDAGIIDVGGGASSLPEDLLAKGYRRLSVLDISQEALNQSRKRLGGNAEQITWFEKDILKADLPQHAFGLWHDRAVFHFLTKEEDRRAYLEILKHSLKPEGFVIIASFSLEGPQKCSGLEVMRYSPETLSEELGKGFRLLKSVKESHQTPFGTHQEFVYVCFQAAA